MAHKKVLLLLSDAGEHIVCDEYYPSDYGRVHMAPLNKYGHFVEDDMQLDYQKVSIPIVEIVYEGDTWPEGVKDRTAEGVLAYFGVQTQ